MNYKRIIKLFLCGLIPMLFCAGCSLEQRVSSEEEALVFFREGLQGEETAGAEEVPHLKVFVCGAVDHGCVVELPQGSRVEDALEAAGGFAPQAHREYLNLARVLVDGEKLYFPTVEEAEVLLQQEALARSGLVDINRADLSGLCTLPGIGESRAADIIAYREQQGLFSTVEDLLKVDCITESIYNKLADKITVGQ